MHSHGCFLWFCYLIIFACIFISLTTVVATNIMTTINIGICIGAGSKAIALNFDVNSSISLQALMLHAWGSKGFGMTESASRAGFQLYSEGNSFQLTPVAEDYLFKNGERFVLTKFGQPDCAITCRPIYLNGATVDLTNIPADGHHFDLTDVDSDSEDDNTPAVAVASATDTVDVTDPATAITAPVAAAANVTAPVPDLEDGHSIAVGTAVLTTVGTLNKPNAEEQDDDCGGAFNHGSDEEGDTAPTISDLPSECS